MTFVLKFDGTLFNWKETSREEWGGRIAMLSIFMTIKWELWTKQKTITKTSMSCTLNCIPTCCCGYSSVENPHTQKKVNEFFSIFYDKSTRFVALCVIVDFIFFYWIEFTHTPLWWCKAKCALSLTRCRYAIKKL